MILKEKEFIKNFEEHFCDIEDHRQTSKTTYGINR